MLRSPKRTNGERRSSCQSDQPTGECLQLGLEFQGVVRKLIKPFGLRLMENITCAMRNMAWRQTLTASWNIRLMQFVAVSLQFEGLVTEYRGLLDWPGSICQELQTFTSPVITEVKSTIQCSHRNWCNCLQYINLGESLLCEDHSIIVLGLGCSKNYCKQVFSDPILLTRMYILDLGPRRMWACHLNRSIHYYKKGMDLKL